MAETSKWHVRELIQKLADGIRAQRNILYKENGQAVSETNRLPVEATVTSNKVKIGSITYGLSNGSTLIGKAADRPDPVLAAQAVFEGVYYHAHDTGEIHQATGSTWRKIGVA